MKNTFLIFYFSFFLQNKADILLSWNFLPKEQHCWALRRKIVGDSWTNVIFTNFNLWPLYLPSTSKVMWLFHATSYFKIYHFMVRLDLWHWSLTPPFIVSNSFILTTLGLNKHLHKVNSINSWTDIILAFFLPLTSKTKFMV